LTTRVIDRMSNPLHNYFHAKTVAEIATTGDVVTVKTSQTVEHAIRMMSDNKILSVPVLDEDGKCCGVLDYLDVVAFVLSVAPDQLSLQANELRSLEIAGRAMAFQEVKEIIGMSGRDPYIPVYQTEPASHPVDLFAGGLHRAPVLDAEDKVLGTISQSSIVRELAANLHMGDLKETGAKTLADLGLGQVQPVTVTTVRGGGSVGGS
jgi:CBS domain-containing protein